MRVGNTLTGEAINLEDNPFNAVEMYVPGVNLLWQCTDDLGQGNQTMQPVGNSMTNNPDWASSSHYNHSNARNGQGNLIVIRNSPTDRLFMRLYNAVNPCGGSALEKGMALAQNAPKVHFRLHFFNIADPNVQGIADGCFFQNVAPLQVSNGTNNSQDTDSWTYLATTIYRDAGDIVPSADGQATGNYSTFNTDLGTMSSSYHNSGNLTGTGDDHLVTT